jgi:hypothetical protein
LVPRRGAIQDGNAVTWSPAANLPRRADERGTIRLTKPDDVSAAYNQLDINSRRTRVANKRFSVQFDLFNALNSSAIFDTNNSTARRRSSEPIQPGCRASRLSSNGSHGKKGGDVMRMHHALFIFVALLAGGAVATAQELGPGAGVLEIGGFPGGALWLVSGDDNTEVNFNNWSYGGGLSWYRGRCRSRLKRPLGSASRKGELSQPRSRGGAGAEHDGHRRQRRYLPGGGNRRLAPYVTGGAGTLTLISRSRRSSSGSPMRNA